MARSSIKMLRLHDSEFKSMTVTGKDSILNCGWWLSQVLFLASMKFPLFSGFQRMLLGRLET